MAATMLEYASAQRSVKPMGTLTTTRKRGTLMAGKKSSRTPKPKEFHGKAHLPEYGIWIGIKRRCTNTNDPAYRYYGGRGIEMCERWVKSFAAFYEDMGPRPDGYEIDRINNDGNYEPGNCRWTTQQENARNKRNSRMLTHNRRTQNLIAWAEETGISAPLILHRMEIGWTVDEALTIPAEKSLYTVGSKTQTLDSWSEEYGIDYGLLISRLHQGWTLERSLSQPVRHFRRFSHDGLCLSLSQWSKRSGISQSVLRYRINAGLTITQALAATPFKHLEKPCQ